MGVIPPVSWPRLFAQHGGQLFLLTTLIIVYYSEKSTFFGGTWRVFNHRLARSIMENSPRVMVVGVQVRSSRGQGRPGGLPRKGQSALTPAALRTFA